MIAAPNRNVHNFDGTGISLPLYYMVGLASFGTMIAMISTGARIAGERQVGWTRQLRITPLSHARLLPRQGAHRLHDGGLSSCCSTSPARSLGVSLPAGRWLEMTGLILVGLLPFAALGIMLGHLLNVDSIGPATGGVVSLLAFLGGTWFPLTHGFLLDLGRLLPSYWLVQAAHVGLTGHGWPPRAWITVGAWALVLVVGAAWAFRRDTQRVA